MGVVGHRRRKREFDVGRTGFRRPREIDSYQVVPDQHGFAEDALQRRIHGPQAAQFAARCIAENICTQGWERIRNRCPTPLGARIQLVENLVSAPVGGHVFPLSLVCGTAG